MFWLKLAVLVVGLEVAMLNHGLGLMSQMCPQGLLLLVSLSFVAAMPAVQKSVALVLSTDNAGLESTEDYFDVSEEATGVS